MQQEDGFLSIGGAVKVSFRVGLCVHVTQGFFCYTTRTMEKDLKNKTQSELRDLVNDLGGKPYFAKYIFGFIHKQGVSSLHDITPLSKAFRENLEQVGYYISRLELVQTFKDPDGTIKYLFATNTGLRFESVLLSDAGRHTLCISCQSGCRMGCQFCATGQLAFQGNLSGAQIADQVHEAEQQGVTIHNLVYMGMGEPLDNPNEVLRSIAILRDPDGKNMGQRHITVSTCGLPSGIVRLAKTEPQVRLALSLHAPDDTIRARIMPVANRHALFDVMEAVREAQAITGRRVTFEYCLISRVNDSPVQARQLAGLLRGIKANVNLIEFNEFSGSRFRASNKETIQAFAQIVKDQGIETVIRYKRGLSIKAACGQLGADWLGKKV
jgi:23S rRNA (adenine2503-C2)-methyltransferase